METGNKKINGMFLFQYTYYWTSAVRLSTSNGHYKLRFLDYVLQRVRASEHNPMTSVYNNHFLWITNSFSPIICILKKKNAINFLLYFSAFNFWLILILLLVRSINFLLICHYLDFLYLQGLFIFIHITPTAPHFF